jgi:hypothetical protein
MSAGFVKVLPLFIPGSSTGLDNCTLQLLYGDHHDEHGSTDRPLKPHGPSHVFSFVGVQHTPTIVHLSSDYDLIEAGDYCKDHHHGRQGYRQVA